MVGPWPRWLARPCFVWLAPFGGSAVSTRQKGVMDGDDDWTGRSGKHLGRWGAGNRCQPRSQALARPSVARGGSSRVHRRARAATHTVRQVSENRCTSTQWRLHGQVAAVEAGTVVVNWYQLPAGAKLATKSKPKPVLVASGRLTFSAAGTNTIKLKLTAQGQEAPQARQADQAHREGHLHPYRQVVHYRAQDVRAKAIRA
jgi:hypothetical protein